MHKMIQENEVVMFFFGLGGLWFILKHHSQIIRIKNWQWIIASFYLLLVAWVATILESYFLANVLNLIEHLCYVSSAILFFIWCMKLVLTTKQSE